MVASWQLLPRPARPSCSPCHTPHSSTPVTAGNPGAPPGLRWQRRESTSWTACACPAWGQSSPLHPPALPSGSLGAGRVLATGVTAGQPIGPGGKALMQLGDGRTAWPLGRVGGPAPACEPTWPQGRRPGPRVPEPHGGRAPSSNQANGNVFLEVGVRERGALREQKLQNSE